MSRRGLLLVAGFLAMLPDTVVSQTPLSLSEADIQELVDAHNLFRGMVDPPASNIQSLQWNEELARVAQAHAASCSFSDNTNRADNVSFATVGENLSASNAGTPNYTLFVEMGWFSQRDNYNYQTNMCTTQDSCTDYIQLVWADTTEVGCGAVRCPTIDGFPLPNSVLLVCNYAPEGRIENGRPYILGNFCSNCSDGTICVNNLCTPLQPTTPPPRITTQIVSTTDAVTTITSPPTEPTTNPPTTIPPTTIPPTTVPPTTNPPTTVPPTTNPPTTVPPTTNPPTTIPPTTNPPTTVSPTREETTITIPSTTGTPISTLPVSTQEPTQEPTTATTDDPPTTEPCDLYQAITKMVKSNKIKLTNTQSVTIRKKLPLGTQFIAYFYKVIFLDKSKTDCSTTPNERSDTRPRRRKTRWSKSKSTKSTKSTKSKSAKSKSAKSKSAKSKSKNSRRSRLRSIKKSKSKTKRRSPKKTKKQRNRSN